MAKGAESLAGDHLQIGACGIGEYFLPGDSGSREGEIVCYTQRGHRRPPLDGDLEMTDLYYPSEIPDVHLSF